MDQDYFFPFGICFPSFQMLDYIHNMSQSITYGSVDVINWQGHKINVIYLFIFFFLKTFLFCCSYNYAYFYNIDLIIIQLEKINVIYFYLFGLKHLQKHKMYIQLFFQHFRTPLEYFIFLYYSINMFSQSSSCLGQSINA